MVLGLAGLVRWEGSEEKEGCELGGLGVRDSLGCVVVAATERRRNCRCLRSAERRIAHNWLPTREEAAQTQSARGDELGDRLALAARAARGVSEK